MNGSSGGQVRIGVLAFLRVIRRTNKVRFSFGLFSAAHQGCASLLRLTDTFSVLESKVESLAIG